MLLMASYKLLCLHGSEQNAEVFRTKIGRFPHKAQRANIQITYLNAPHIVPLRPGDEVPLRTWYLREEGGKIRKETIEESLSFLEKAWKDGNFDGILGFSQGGIPTYSFFILTHDPSNHLPSYCPIRSNGSCDGEYATTISKD